MLSACDCASAGWPSARGSSSLRTERASNVVVMTKKMIRQSTTSISGIRLISGSSSLRWSRMRIGSGCVDRGRDANCTGRDACGCRACVERVEQLDGFVLHVDDVTSDAPAEVAVEHQCRNGDDHAGGRAYERLADATGELADIA